MITFNYLTLIRPRLNSRNKTEPITIVSRRILTDKLVGSGNPMTHHGTFE